MEIWIIEVLLYIHVTNNMSKFEMSEVKPSYSKIVHRAFLGTVFQWLWRPGVVTPITVVVLAVPIQSTIDTTNYLTAHSWFKVINLAWFSSWFSPFLFSLLCSLLFSKPLCSLFCTLHIDCHTSTTCNTQLNDTVFIA